MTQNQYFRTLWDIARKDGIDEAVQTDVLISLVRNSREYKGSLQQGIQKLLQGSQDPSINLLYHNATRLAECLSSKVIKGIQK